MIINSIKGVSTPKNSKPPVMVPPGRVSVPNIPGLEMDEILDNKNNDYVKIKELIPKIRKLTWLVPDMGLAVHDMVQLTNTGHVIEFDKSVSPEQIDAMRKHIEEVQKKWGDGVAGMRGTVNKLIAQMWISGAISGEWVVNNSLTGIDNVVLVDPETIEFRWDKSIKRFLPYQKQPATLNGWNNDPKKLNTITYKYFGLNGDQEIPYGIPPLITALEAISTQRDMTKNIRFIMKQMGLMGFFETLIEKPGQDGTTNDSAYKAQLMALLSETKKNLVDGLNDGLVVGFKDDHEFNFHSTTKNVGGVNDLFNQNQMQVANGMKTPPVFLGVSGTSGTETGITIIFTKMLSQLKNVQSLLEAFLSYGYSLELRLAGFKFKYLNVKFNPSTITDDLKLWQSKEIKQRVARALYDDGIISQDTYAEMMGFDSPDQDDPRISRDPSDQVDAEVKRKDREKKKDESDKKTREKNKPQPKRNDQK